MIFRGIALSRTHDAQRKLSAVPTPRCANFPELRSNEFFKSLRRCVTSSRVKERLQAHEFIEHRKQLIGDSEIGLHSAPLLDHTGLTCDSDVAPPSSQSSRSLTMIDRRHKNHLTLWYIVGTAISSLPSPTGSFCRLPRNNGVPGTYFRPDPHSFRVMNPASTHSPQSECRPSPASVSTR
jgi:hypothetical protein